VLAFAADEERIPVSHDFHTMPKHFREFIRVRPSPGVLLIRQDLPVAGRSTSCYRFGRCPGRTSGRTECASCQAWSRLQLARLPNRRAG
jgi:hypothetical protein